MDICVIDWRAFTPIIASLIATGIASFTALYISRKCSKQKGAEIIADESKQVIKDTLEMVKIINYIGSGSSKKDDLKDLDVFKKLFESVVINTAFIEDSIIDNSLKISFSLFSKKSIPINKMISAQKIEVGDTNLSPLISEFNEAAISLVNVLNPYSIYRKPCKFKKK